MTPTDIRDTAIPEDVMKKAEEAYSDSVRGGHDTRTFESRIQIIARAIMAATEAERERCAKIAECHFDDRGNGRSGHHSEMDWTDGYRDATRGAASAIRAGTKGASHD